VTDSKPSGIAFRLALLRRLNLVMVKQHELCRRVEGKVRGSAEVG